MEPGSSALAGKATKLIFLINTRNNIMLNYHIHNNGWTVILDDFNFAVATQQDINHIAQLLATNTCVVVHNQGHLSLSDEIRVCEMFGQIEDSSAFSHLPLWHQIMLPGGQGKIHRVTGALDEHGNPGLFGHVSDLDWHCNQPGVPDRKPLVWLMGVSGTVGSRTSWTNNIMAYEDLSPDVKNSIQDLRMVCGWRKDSYSEFDFSVAKTGKTEDFNEHYTPHMVHTNIAGKTGLFFPFLQFRNFVGMTEEDSRQFIKPLIDHVLQEKYMYHHDWQDGDVVIAEQWLGIHKRWRFDGMDKRMLHRITFDFTHATLE
jgi:alpha-ketoglutarate-dependent taurine dioxygenase